VSTPMELDDSQENGQSPVAINRNPPLTVDSLRDGVPFSYLCDLKKKKLEDGSVVRGIVKVHF
jgi:hypothetical protein